MSNERSNTSPMFRNALENFSLKQRAIYEKISALASRQGMRAFAETFIGAHEEDDIDNPEEFFAFESLETRRNLEACYLAELQEFHERFLRYHMHLMTPEGVAATIATLSAYSMPENVINGLLASADDICAAELTPFRCATELTPFRCTGDPDVVQEDNDDEKDPIFVPGTKAYDEEKKRLDAELDEYNKNDPRRRNILD